MLIYKAMNVFPSAIRDVVLKHFEPLITGYVQVVKDHPQQVRFDDPIPVDIEVREAPADPGKLTREIENKVRDILTIRITANLVKPGAIERTQYKTPLVRVGKK
jgi:phenylacetate-coenzyme A ligase PaaK-like adenylate-forming protein